jgi:hypothetical protein
MWVFRLWPIVYFVAAPIILAFSIFMYFDIEGDDAAKKAASKHAAPAAVALEAFDAAKNKADFGEVVLMAQLDPKRLVDVTEEKDGVKKVVAFVAPLYPTNAKDTTAAAPAVLMTADPLPNDKIEKMVAGQGAFGPVIKINGFVSDDSSLIGKVDNVRKDTLKAVAITPTPVYIEPFVNGREAGLKPSGGGMVVLIIGSLIALALAGFGYFRFRTA